MRSLLGLIALALLLAAPAQAFTSPILGNPIAPQQSTVAEHSHTFTGLNLYSLNVANPAAVGYVLIYDATSAPTDGSVTPKACYNVSATGGSVPLGQWPMAFTTGITVVASSTGCTTQTSQNAFFTAQTR